MTKNDDVHNIKDGIYSYHNDNKPSNSYGYNALLIQISSLEGNIYKYQVAIASNEQKAAVKFYYGSWSSWIEL